MKSKNARISKSYRPPRVGITIGDPGGIGPLVAIKAIHLLKDSADFVVIGDAWVLEQAAKITRQRADAICIDLNNVGRRDFAFGKIKAEYGRASIEYLDTALNLIKQEKIDCLVTCPISKEAINKAGLAVSGHTEYFADKTKRKDLAMMLLNRELKFSLVTRHIALKDVSSQLDPAKIYKTIILTFKSLQVLFRIKKPRLVVCGLNPHASDNGLIGNEEATIIKPVLKKIKTEIGFIDGPKPADIAILETRRKHYDCVIAMYHDQALIPLKLSGNQYGVNLTLGLPFIRTSPLHGTAFDIAGTNLADPSSLTEAIRLAIRCSSNLTKN